MISSTTPNRIFDIGLTVLRRAENDLESAQENALVGKIELAIQDDISFLKRLTRRLLAIQVEHMWIAKDHAEKASPGISEGAHLKAEKTFQKLIELLREKPGTKEPTRL